MGKANDKRLLGRPRRRWNDNIKIDCIWLAQNRDLFEGSYEHGNEPSGPLKCSATLE
jgi:hypothetical protein